jgi:hypothetical protein
MIPCYEIKGAELIQVIRKANQQKPKKHSSLYRLRVFLTKLITRRKLT